MRQRTGKARINGSDLYFEERGAGTPLVFVHGAANTGDMWRPQVEALSRRGRVISYDLRGHGRSGPTRGRFTIRQLARDLAGLLDHLEATPAVVCGFSLGGCVAQELAARSPEKLRGLAICDSVGDSVAGPARGLARGLLALSAPFVSRRGVLGVADLATRPMRRDVQRYFLEVAERNLRRMSRSEILEVASSLVEFRKPDLSRFEGPAMVVVGAREPRRIRGEARRLAGRIPGATLEVIDKAQHGPNRENVAAFNAAIARLLDEVEARDRRAA